MNFRLIGHCRGAEASTLLQAPDLALHGSKNHNPATQFRYCNSKSITGRETAPRGEITSNSWPHKTTYQSKGDAFGEQGRKGEPNPASRSYLCVSRRLWRWRRERDNAGEARVLRYRVDASATEFAPAGLADHSGLDRCRGSPSAVLRRHAPRGAGIMHR
jgi:hypothetical protein